MARIGTGGRFTKGAGLTAWAGLQEKGRFRAGLSINHPEWDERHTFKHIQTICKICYFGLTSLTLSITAYLTGFLNGKYERLLPYFFHSIWISILALHFLIITYVKFQILYETNFFDFLLKFIFTFGYTMMFFLVVQFFFPVKDATRAKIS